MADTDWGLLYDFCLDWQMDHVSKDNMIKRFPELNLTFDQFKKAAQHQNWFVASMNDLQNKA